MTRLFLLFSLSISIAAVAQEKQYVCPPCGLACDNVVYSKPGTCPSCHMTLVAKSAIQFENLTPSEFCDRITANPNAVLLDVRSKGEFDGSGHGNTYGHFKNAININIDELEQRLGELEKYKSREILVYCSHSVRSPRAAMILKEHGFKKVANLSGGISRMNPKENECLIKNYIVH